MLTTRLSIGAALVLMLAGLAWADLHAPRPGLMLAPLAAAAASLGAVEIARVFEHNPQLAGGSARRRHRHQRVVAAAAVVVALSAFAPSLAGMTDETTSRSLTGAGGMAIGLAAAMTLLLGHAVATFRPSGNRSTAHSSTPHGSTPPNSRGSSPSGRGAIRLAVGIFAVAYCGGMIGFAAQLRLLSGGPWGEDGRWGVVAVLSMIAAAKACDTGGYFAGRRFGRRALAPLLSPKKTQEGALGGVVFAVIASAVTLGPLAEWLGCQPRYGSPLWSLGVLVYGLSIAAAAVLGDLAISLLKRDAQLKDSSSWMPGFGGVLDVLDSVLLAAPVAYLLWLLRVVGP